MKMKLFAENLKEYSEKEILKFKKLKEGVPIESGDLVYILDNLYAIIGKKSILCKYTVNKFNSIYRKK